MISKILKYLTVTFLVIFAGSCKNTPNYLSKKLDSNWTFKAIKDSVWLKAIVPGSVHTDLIANQIIKDPFYRLNEKNVQWVDKQDWEYQTSFTVEKTLFEKDVIELDFKGLDTYASIFLNNQLILETNNMFVGYKIDCKKHLKQGENSLKIIFKSPIQKGLEKRNQLGYQLPNAVNDQSENGGLGKKQVAVFSRKAGYHFGWDWGPRLVSSGIWKEIKLNAWNKANITDVYIQQNQLSKKEASLNAQIEIMATSPFSSQITILVDDENAITQNVDLKKGSNKIKIPIRIKKPKLWWTNGLGAQKLYTITTKLHQQEKTLAVDSKKIGLKTLEVVQDKDSIGESFYFKLNGHPVFMKGANYIPQDVFLNRVTRNDYQKIIKNMVDANFNMIRVWGGGIYEKDLFYDLCDENGILVWQDFMFACAMYPGDTSFLKNVKKEAEYNVKRLRNHTSIALWCGNNENLTAWKNWGWINEVKNTQGDKIVDTIWKGYQDVFHTILPKVVQELDNDTFYWASSPTSARGKDATLTSGDYHYWKVWGQQAPLTTFNTYIPRFMSEYGFQSFPEFKAVKQYTTQEDWSIYSDVMNSHQRSPIGNKNIEMYMKSWYNTPKDFESFLYVSQLLQAKAMKIAIEAHRRNMPYCMGSLYWQINDCWPVASWSSIDYYGNWKASHYKVKELYAPVKTLFFKTDNTIDIHIVSDYLTDTKAKLHLKLINFKGEILNQTEAEITVKANSSNIYLNLKEEEFTKKHNLKEALLVSELMLPDQTILDESMYYFKEPNKLNLTKPTLSYTVKLVSKKEVLLQISTNTLAKNVRFSTSLQGHFSNNYFDVLPNKTHSISFTSAKEINVEEFKQTLTTTSLINTY